MKKTLYLELSLVFLATLLFNAYFSLFGVDYHHDGLMLKPALDVAKGLILFKDTSTQYGALVIFIQAFALKIFGPYLLVLKLTTALFYALTSIFLWIIWSRFLSKPWLLFSLISWFLLAPYYLDVFHIWPSAYALLFQTITLYLLIRSLEKNQKNILYQFSIGIMAALTFWCRQPVGIYLVAAITFFYVLLKFFNFLTFKELIKYCAGLFGGFFFVNLLFILFFYSTHSLQGWWLQSIMMPYYFGGGATGIQTFKDFFIPTFQAKRNYILIVFPLVNLFIFLQSVKTIYQRKIPTNLILLATSIVCLASLLQYYPVIEVRHFYWAATPVFGLLAYFLQSLNLAKTITKISINNKLSRNEWFGLIAATIIFSLMFIAIYSRFKHGNERLNQIYVFTSSPKILQGMFVLPEDKVRYPAINELVNNYLNTHPGKNFVNITGYQAPLLADGLSLTFSDRVTNIHPVYMKNWPEVTKVYPNYDQVFKHYIQAYHPLLSTNPKMLPKNYVVLYYWKGRDEIFAAYKEK